MYSDLTVRSKVPDVNNEPLSQSIQVQEAAFLFMDFQIGKHH